MRTFPLLLLVGCGLKHLLPGPPVVTGADRADYDAFQPSGAQYSDAAPSGPLVLPVQAWGLRYALDVVLETTHPDWIMHEYARIDLPATDAGPARGLWIAKDADTAFVQTITSDVPDIRSWLPEIPVPRHPGNLVVTDASAGDAVDLRFQYENPHGDAVDVHYAGPLPTKPSKPRNGNTMGHSQASLAALLDIHLYQPGGDASVSIGGEVQHIRKLFGLYPMKFLLAQTQGGFAIADFVEHDPAPTGQGFSLTRPGGAGDWPTQGEERWTDAPDGWVEREGPVTTLRYRFVGGELDRVEVEQAGIDFPVVRAVFQPALPDLRRRFTGEVHSRFVVDIAGQEGHGIGTTTARWEGDEAVLDLVPVEPSWFADRPMQTRVQATAAGPRVRIQRVPVPPPR